MVDVLDDQFFFLDRLAREIAVTDHFHNFLSLLYNAVFVIILLDCIIVIETIGLQAFLGLINRL